MVNWEDTEEEYSVDKIAEDSRQLQESATKIIKEGSQKFKERYIDNNENTSSKLKEDAAKFRKLYMEGAENAADTVIEKTKEVGQQLLEKGTNYVKKVGDYIVPEEVVTVGFNSAVNQETPVAAYSINGFAIEGAVQYGQKISSMGQSFSDQLHEKIGVELSCDISTLPPKNVDAEYLSACNYALHRFDNSQRSCTASANNSLLLKGSELVSGTIQSICETACEHRKAFDSCIEEHDKEANLTQRQSDEFARQAIKVKNASAEYECIDNDLVISELDRLRQFVKL